MNVILGGGITGLIYCYYHKDHFILTDQIGGQMNSSFDLGPRYLHHKSRHVIDFLKSLEIPIENKIIKVGYLDDNGWIENTTLDFRQSYFMKSRGTNIISGFEPTVLNTNVKEFSVCNIDFKDLITKLFCKISHRIYTSQITKIDLVEQLIISKDSTIKYEKLVSTIPLNVFCKLSDTKQDLESISMSYCLMSQDFFDLKNFDFIYDNRTTSKCHRMTKCKKGIVCDVLEKNLDDFKKTNNVLEYKTISNSQIISLDKDFEIKDHPEIKFIGRYGAWNRKYKTEIVIEEAQK